MDDNVIRIERKTARKLKKFSEHQSLRHKMKINLVYKDHNLGKAWNRYFSDIDDVSVIEGDICEIECDAVVSPSNSYGFMDGGLDCHLSERFGWNLQENLQKKIGSLPIGELLVGEALIIPTNDIKIPWLISAPTMRVPMVLRQTVNAYLSMKAILAAVISHKENPPIIKIAVPGLGTGCGALDYGTAALQMWTAYREIVLKEISYPNDFGEAQKSHINLNKKDIILWD